MTDTDSSTSRMAPRIRGRATAAARALAPDQPVPPASPRSLFIVAAVGSGLLLTAGLLEHRPGHPHLVDRRARRIVGARFTDRLPTRPWWLGGRQTRRHAVAEALGGITGHAPTIVAGALAGLAVGWRRGPLPALPVLAAVPLSLGAHGAIKYTVKRPRPFTARLTGKHTPSFPSGHAARGAAAAVILAYVAAREGVLDGRIALPLGGALALAGGGARVYVDRHWVSDAVGGWALGAAVGALCARGYDAARERRPRRRRQPPSSDGARRAAAALAVAR